MLQIDLPLIFYWSGLVNARLFFKLTIHDHFLFFVFLISIDSLQLADRNTNLPMTGFELRISVCGTEVTALPTEQPQPNEATLFRQSQRMTTMLQICALDCKSQKTSSINLWPKTTTYLPFNLPTYQPSR